MKLNKAVLIICIAILGIFTVAQLSYAYTMMVNLSQQTDGKNVATKVEDAVKDAGENKPLASNATLKFGEDFILELKSNKEAVIKLNGVDLNMIAAIESPADYAVGALSVGLANHDIAKDGNTYNLSDSAVSPLIFSEDFATNKTQQFSDAVTAMQPDQIAVIIAINMTSEDIKKAIEGKVDLSKVVIVQATTTESQIAFNVLFDENKEGFSLRALDRNSPNVIKALQGAV